MGNNHWMTPFNGVKHYFITSKDKKRSRPLCGEMQKETGYYQEDMHNDDWLQRAEECKECALLISKKFDE